MHTYRRVALVALVVVMLAALASPAFAQEGQEPDPQTTRTVVISEDRINSSYRVTNPSSRHVSSLHVDLQPGQIVISATLRFRGHDPIDTETVLVPRVENRRLFWDVSTVMIDGVPADSDLYQQIHQRLSSSWRAFLKNHAAQGRILSVTITDTDLTLELVGRPGLASGEV
jgi:hypothetical protein